MRIYIRHAEKAYRNGKPTLTKQSASLKEQKYTYAHDPPLTESGKRAAKNLALELLRKYPAPTQILTSPYVRARQTAVAMAKVVVGVYPPAVIEVVCRADLSEYLGHHSRNPLDVTPSTALHNPPHPENFYSFRERIQLHYSSWSESDDVTWVITHGIVISEILRPYRNVRDVPYLGYITTRAPYYPPEISFLEEPKS